MSAVLDLLQLNDAVEKQYDESFLSSDVDSQTEFRLDAAVEKALQSRFSRFTPAMGRSIAMLQYCHVPPYVFIDPEKIVETSRYMACHYDKLSIMFGEPMEWDDQIPDRPRQRDFCICNKNWNLHWLPIARFFDEELLFMDLDPGPNGTLAQIVQLYDDDMGLWVQGKSVSGWLKRITQAVDDGLFDEYLITPSDMMRSYPI